MEENKNIENKSFRHSAAFGKRIEYYVIGLMLKEGLDVYLPMVDDDAIEKKVIKEDDPENKSRKYASYIPFWA